MKCWVTEEDEDEVGGGREEVWRSRMLAATVSL